MVMHYSMIVESATVGDVGTLVGGIHASQKPKTMNRDDETVDLSSRPVIPQKGNLLYRPPGNQVRGRSTCSAR